MFLHHGLEIFYVYFYGKAYYIGVTWNIWIMLLRSNGVPLNIIVEDPLICARINLVFIHLNSCQIHNSRLYSLMS